MSVLGWIISLLLTIAPRIILLILWLFTPFVSAVFPNWIAPLLGLLALPFTALAYMIAWDPTSGLGGLGWLIVIGGLALDLGSYALGIYVSRAQKADARQA